MPTREEEFTRVRDLLDYPLFQRPSPHSIVSGLIRQEQFQANKLNNTGRPWTQNSLSLTTVADTAEYTVAATDFGKPLFVYRALANNVLLPVPFTDYTHEIHNQSYEFWIAPFEAEMNPQYSGDKIAFFRTSAGVKKARIYPVPEEAGVVYTVVYASGWQDWSGFAIGDVPILPEWSDHRTLAVAMFQLPKAEWEGLTRAENREKREELAIGLQTQFAMQSDAFESYVRNPVIEPVSEVGFWHE